MWAKFIPAYVNSKAKLAIDSSQSKKVTLKSAAAKKHNKPKISAINKQANGLPFLSTYVSLGFGQN